MAKKRASLIVKTDLSDILTSNNRTTTPTTKTVNDRMTVEQALATVTRQMEISGNRARTISDYKLHVEHFVKVASITYVDEILTESVYRWLASMEVGAQTKLTRLKCLKAFLSRCFDNGWLASKFWKTIQIKVDNNVKEGATERDINTLLSVLDLGDFVQLRDATAALLMYKTGIRINTIVLLENKHVDLSEKMLRLDGAIMKNHDHLLLPIDDALHRLLSVLIDQNGMVRREYGKQNNYVFITMFGDMIATGPTHNNIQKRLNKYAREYGLRNINPHALRRGFAKSLLDKGANIAVISKALGHSSLAVTTKYLHIDKEEIADSLRKYL